ncbi:MAG TPA: hypothetical protein DEP28_00365 [Bacteroidetes bacterium]|nr:hypothetical protein [Bacteroidota bacterium]
MNYFFLAGGVMGLENLRFLSDSNLKPSLVVFSKDEEIKNFCHENNIEFKELSNDSSNSKNISSLTEVLKSYDFGICSGFMQIIPGEIITTVRKGIFNIHCGKLPDYRGRAPISRTIMDGLIKLTVTIHKMDEGVDSGDILDEETVLIDEMDNVNDVYKKATLAASELIVKNLEKINSGKYKLSPQDLSIKPKANLKITKEERRIKWSEPVEVIYNQIRALTYPYPGAFFIFNGKEFIIDSAIKSADFKNEMEKEKSLYGNNNSLAIIKNVSGNGVQIDFFSGSLLITKIRDESDFSIFNIGDKIE